MPASTRARIKARALRLLALREHSRAELETKLRPRLGPGGGGWPAAGRVDGGRTSDVEGDVDGNPEPLAADIAGVLDELERLGLLSDQRTADALLAAKAPRYGHHRLRQLLQAKSLAPELVHDTLQRAREGEFERALDIWRRRFGHAPLDPRQRARQQRFLAGRGFESSVIERVMKHAATASPDRSDGN